MTKLKEFRTARGISQQELAELVGVSRQTISKWENDIVQPTAGNLKCLSQVLQLPLEAFLRDDWKPPEQQAVEVVAILPETPQDTDAEPAVTPKEAPPDTDAEPAATPAETPPDIDAEPAATPTEEPPESVGEVPAPRRWNYRLWAALAAIIAVIGLIAGVISFNGRGDDVTPISRIERTEVDQFQSIAPVTLLPLQP